MRSRVSRSAPHQQTDRTACSLADLAEETLQRPFRDTGFRVNSTPLKNNKNKYSEVLKSCFLNAGLSALEVFAEFNRIVSKNLQMDFFDALDCHTPRFVTIFKSKKGTVGETLTELVQQIDSGKPDVTAMRTIVLQGLPVLLGDDPSNFYKTCFDCDSDETWAQVFVGMLNVVPEDMQLSKSAPP